MVGDLEIDAQSDGKRGRRRLPQVRGRRLWRVPFVCVLAALLLGLGGGIAWAYIGATGTGTGTVTVTLAQVTTTTMLSTISSVTLGKETSEAFSGTVTGSTGHGYPKKGSVKVVATSTVGTPTSTVLCTSPLTGSGYASTFTCKTKTNSKLAAGTYKVHADFTGGQSSTDRYFYKTSTSTPQTLVVVGVT